MRLASHRRNRSKARFIALCCRGYGINHRLDTATTPKTWLRAVKAVISPTLRTDLQRQGLTPNIAQRYTRQTKSVLVTPTAVRFV